MAPAGIAGPEVPFRQHPIVETRSRGQTNDQAPSSSEGDIGIIEGFGSADAQLPSSSRQILEVAGVGSDGLMRTRDPAANAHHHGPPAAGGNRTRNAFLKRRRDGCAIVYRSRVIPDGPLPARRYASSTDTKCGVRTPRPRRSPNLKPPLNEWPAIPSRDSSASRPVQPSVEMTRGAG